MLTARLVHDFYAIQHDGPASNLEAEPGGRRKSEIQSPAAEIQIFYLQQCP